MNSITYAGTLVIGWLVRHRIVVLILQLVLVALAIYLVATRRL
jgi:hypothetical protein